MLAGAGYYFYTHQEEVIGLIKEISYWRIIASLVLLLIGKLFIVVLVKFSVEAEGWSPSFWETLGIYGLTSMGKYIPGGIWHFVGRFGIYRANNLDNKQTARAFILENIWLLSAAIAVGVCALSLYRFDLISYYLRIPQTQLVSISFAVGTLVLWFGGLYLVKLYFNNKTKTTIRPIWQIIPTSLLLWIFIGLSFFVMFENYPITSGGLFVGAYAVSWSVGYLAVFAPGGLGIREAVLALVFSTVSSPEKIAVYAAMNRVVWLVAELLFGLAGYLQKPQFRSGESSEGQVVEGALLEPSQMESKDPTDLVP